ncbi:Serine/threonine protein kinase [Parasponia andersonii]|uniref:Serine/threonine protein kinase n=1 Tax=Parasponia andersonii TaxID=3476 RepID=A0A2P5AI73_PARAD|nr:Serine/threonine protein kinase [Parasponia andersonii]
MKHSLASGFDPKRTMLLSQLFHRCVLIKRNHFRGLSLSIVKLCSKQILCGLALLKDAGIIHCDLKAENIFLCTRGTFHMLTQTSSGDPSSGKWIHSLDLLT